MTQEVPNPLLGREIAGKYRIVRLLGEGGMGAVYLGEQKLGATLRKVAIKTLHPHLSHDPKILARFEREVGTVAGLQHPNTIQVFDFGKMDDGTLYIVMEFVEGRSVADVLEKDGPMEPARVQKIMEQVCGSLEEAHQQGIVHRDLKPDNVVLCDKAGQKDWVEVLDFGIAKRQSEEDKEEQKLTQQGMVLGTPPYMSPEQFTGKPIDKRSDIYSLGVMAYEMLTGALPFSGNTAWEWATAHMTAQPRPLDTLPVGGRIPPAMKHAISRAMEKDPNARFATVHDFFQAFAGGGGGATYEMAAPRAKTEVGTPVPGAAYGGAPYATPAQGNPNWGTPAQGTPQPQPTGGGQAYTPGPMAQVPPAPTTEGRRGGGGNGILVVLIVLGLLVAVGGVVGYLVTHKSGGGGTTANTGTSTGTGSPTVTLTTPTANPTESSTSEPLASLKGTTTAPPGTRPTVTGTSTKPNPSATATGSTKPNPSTTATATTTATTTATATATHTTTATATTTTPPPPSGPPECDAAKLMRKLGRTNEAETLRIKCVEKGGKDPFAP